MQKFKYFLKLLVYFAWNTPVKTKISNRLKITEVHWTTYSGCLPNTFFPFWISRSSMTATIYSKRIHLSTLAIRKLTKIFLSILRICSLPSIPLPSRKKEADSLRTSKCRSIGAGVWKTYFLSFSRNWSDKLTFWHVHIFCWCRQQLVTNFRLFLIWFTTCFRLHSLGSQSWLRPSSIYTFFLWVFWIAVRFNLKHSAHRKYIRFIYFFRLYEWPLCIAVFRRFLTL